MTLGGHLGITRTEERVRKRFHWPGIRKTVTRHIQWRSQPDNSVPLCKFRSTIIIHFSRN